MPNNFIIERMTGATLDAEKKQITMHLAGPDFAPGKVDICMEESALAPTVLGIMFLAQLFDRGFSGHCDLSAQNTESMLALETPDFGVQRIPGDPPIVLFLGVANAVALPIPLSIGHARELASHLLAATAEAE